MEELVKDLDYLYERLIQVVAEYHLTGDLAEQLLDLADLTSTLKVRCKHALQSRGQTSTSSKTTSRS